MLRLGVGEGPGGQAEEEQALTPLDTAWHRCCIQSAISASLSALSSRQGRSARTTWKAWGRSVVLDPPTATALLPLGQREEGEAGSEAGVAQGSSKGYPQSLRSGGHQRGGQTPRLGSPAPTSFLCNTFNLRITKVLLHTEQGQVRGGESAPQPRPLRISVLCPPLWAWRSLRCVCSTPP